MARPDLTEDQRIVAVTMLANAIRKAERPRPRGQEVTGDAVGGAAGDERAGARGDAVLDLVGRRREEAARQYVRGMHDLLAVLFAGGRPGADAIYAAARAMAFGEPPGWPDEPQPEPPGIGGNGSGRPPA